MSEQEAIELIIQRTAEKLARDMRGIVPNRGYSPEHAAELVGCTVSELHRDCPHIRLTPGGRVKAFWGSDLIAYSRTRNPTPEPIIRAPLIQSDSDRRGVYVVHAEGTDRYKIGIASNLRRRLASLRAMSPVPLKLVLFIERRNRRDCSKHERDLHLRFAGSRLHGEWFAGSPDLIAFLELNGACV